MKTTIVLLVGIIIILGASLLSKNAEEVGAPETQNTDTTQTSDDTNTNTDTNEETVTEETPDVTVSSRNSLDLSGQGLTKAPEYIFSRTSLESLDLSDNNLDGSLQAEIRHLQNLKMLDLSNNNFTGVPAEIGQLGKLEVLNLSGNPLTGLPNELANLKNLKILDLRGTQYSAYDLGIIKQGLPGSVSILVD